MSRAPFKNDQSTPLERGPYSSRVAEQEFTSLDENASKNYVLLGFRAGYALQASELNEVQEHFLLQQTLTTTMICNWAPAIALGQGPGWGYSDYDGNMQEQFGRSGLCPISPNLINVSGSTVTFKRGWYLVQIPEFTGVENDSYRFKVWIYNNDELSFNANQPENSSAGYVGFAISQEFVTETEDGALSDNSAGSGENVVPGATRYKLSITGLTQRGRQVLDSTVIDEDDSPMAIKIENDNYTYISGYPIPVVS